MSTQTYIQNGKRVTRTETSTIDAQGNRSTQVKEETDDGRGNVTVNQYMLDGNDNVEAIDDGRQQNQRRGRKGNALENKRR